MYRNECKKIRSQSIYTDANVVGIEKVNELKGKLIDLEKVQKDLQSQMDGLRKIKDEQWKNLEQIGEIKNYPGKMRELFDAIKLFRT